MNSPCFGAGYPDLHASERPMWPRKDLNEHLLGESRQIGERSPCHLMHANKATIHTGILHLAVD
jgi:hypothetical protein